MTLNEKFLQKMREKINRERNTANSQETNKVPLKRQYLTLITTVGLLFKE